MIMNRKGLNCFRYKQTNYNVQNKVSEYTKCSFDEDAFVDYYLTKDLGEKINNIPNEYHWYCKSELKRNESDLIAVIEELGEEESDGSCSILEIVEIPDDVGWEIDEKIIEIK